MRCLLRTVLLVLLFSERRQRQWRQAPVVLVVLVMAGRGGGHGACCVLWFGFGLEGGEGEEARCFCFSVFHQLSINPTPSHHSINTQDLH